jgi:hypothetical protein
VRARHQSPLRWPKVYLNENSMWPLLKKDGLSIQYIATLILWNRMVGYNPFRLNERSFIRLLSVVGPLQVHLVVR